MLNHTFIHIPGIGKATERSMWSSGIRSWADVPTASLALKGVRSAATMSESIERSEAALIARDSSFFSRLAQMGEAWRLYRAFEDQCVFLDVETTGLSSVFDSITMVGLYDGRDYQVFVEGQNMSELPAVLQRYKVVVTFNGAQFDLRFLRLAFLQMTVPPIHIDLRWVTARLGLRGGLKEVEAALGIRRPKCVANVNGYDATVLWARYQRGDDIALRLLIDYNAQDVVNLRRIMDIAYEQMARNTVTFVQHEPRLRKRASYRKTLNTSLDLLPRQNATSVLVPTLLGRAKRYGNGSRIVGIDLTGSERRATGWALLDGDRVTTCLIQTDEELLRRTLAAKPDCVSIDSPLSLPGGFTDLEAWGKSGLPIYRACELALKRMGISVFWCLLPSMKSLTLRGMKLAQTLRAAGIMVIESYPGAAQDLLHIPRKRASLDELKQGLYKAGIFGSYLAEKTSHDEIDAITSALVGLFYAAKEHIALGNTLEEYLIVPRSPQINYDRLSEILAASGLDSVDQDRPLMSA